MYPENWPRCACGDLVMDGKATCGRAACVGHALPGGGTWRDNPHRPGTRAYYEMEDARRDAGATDVGPAAGTPAWG
jgi:hypothetical protein